MKTVEFGMVPMHDGGQYQLFYEQSRFQLLVKGRRWGGSVLAQNRGLQTATMGGIVWWVWPNYPMSQSGWLKLLQVIEPMRAAGACKIDAVNLRVEFGGGGYMQMKSGERPDTLRGEGLDLLLGDEFAYLKDGKNTFEYKLRPALAEKMGRALLLTSPNGLDHVYEYFNMAAEWPDWYAVRHPSWDNPFMPAAEIEHARKTLPDGVFRQEYGAEFLEDSGGVFDLEAVEKAEWREAPEEGHSYRGSLDLGRKRDSTVLGIWDISTEPVQLVHVKRWLGRGEEQKKDIVETCRYWNVEYLIADGSSLGGLFVEVLDSELDCEVESFTTTAATRQNILRDLRVAFENELMYIPHLEWLRTEFGMMRGSAAPGSLLLRIETREGFHDDGVMMCAMATRLLEVSLPVYG